MDNYEINRKTVVIIPLSNNKSKVVEEDREYIVLRKSTEIVDHSCRYFGSSFLGRHEGTKNLIGVSYKTPILIEETNNIIFFPTSSSRADDCYWISLEQINDYNDYEGNSKIIFKNGYELILNISIGSLENQILRSTRLESVIRKRRKIS